MKLLIGASFLLLCIILLLSSCSEHIYDPRRPDLAKQAKKQQQLKLQY